MVLHKMVNGKKIDLTPEEEADVRAEWKANDDKYAAAEKRISDYCASRKLLKTSVKAKLTKLGLTDEEIALFIKGDDEPVPFEIGAT